MKVNELNEYFKGDSMAADSWADKYQMKDDKDAPLEATPDEMHRRLASEFGGVENKYRREEIEGKNNENLSEFGRALIERRKTQNKNDIINDIYGYFERFRQIVPQGSVMSNLGNKYVFGSLSNCFVVPAPYDSYAGLLKTDEELTQLMKRRGGVGTRLDTLRPSRAKVSNASRTSTGVPSFMERYSNTTREVAQEGRRGALMLLLHCLHPDIFKFVTAKDDKTKVTGANVSSMLTNKFFEAVEADSDFYCRFPIDLNEKTFEDILKSNQDLPYNVMTPIELGHKAVYIMRIHAKELFDLIVEMAWKNAEPGVAYIDRIQDYAPDGVYERFRPTKCNPCQPSFAKLLTKDGIRELGDINIGDEIWSETGWTKVINKWYTGIKPVYNNETTSGRFLGTENHKVVQNKIKIEVKDASSIDILSGNISKPSDFLYDVVMDGLVIGDGSVHLKSKEKVYLTIGENDNCYHESEISDYIKERHPVKHNAWKVDTNISINELPVLSVRVIPKRYYYGDSLTVRSFLRGLYSANGSVVDRRVTLKSTSFELVKQVQTMLSSVGIRSYYTINKQKEVKFENGAYVCKESYDLNIGSDRELFYSTIGFIHAYKMAKLEESFNERQVKYKNQTRDIIRREYIGDYEVFDITVDNDTHTYWTDGVNVSNCGEIWMGDYDACRLIAENYFGFVDNPFTSEATLNLNRAYEVSYMQQRLGDDLVDLEVEYIQRIIDKVKTDPEPSEIKSREINLWTSIRDTTRDGRRTGNGFTALADMLAALGIKYDSQEGLDTIELVMKTKMRAELDASIDMAITRGAFKGYDANAEFSIVNGVLKGNNSFYEMIVNEFPEQATRLYKYGRRNVSWSTVAPTGTVSLMTQTTSGLEPLFKAYYIRRKKINSNDDKNRVDFVDQNGDKWQEYAVLHPKFREWLEINKHNVDEIFESPDFKEVLQSLFEKSPWYGSEANDITWESRVKTNSIIQKYTSNALSCTINLPENVAKSTVANIYLTGWKLGLKGVTVYRDKCRSGVLVTESVKKQTDEFGYTDAPKRPKELNADYYFVTSKGKKYAVIIGLMNSVPYEVFGFESPEVEEHIKGKVIKVKRGVYKFVSEKYNIDNLQLSQEHTDEKLLTRWISLLLRHGANPKFIAEQVEKSEVQITSFPKVMARILKKYIPNGSANEECPQCHQNTMIYEEACKKCTNCGYSRC